MNRALLEILRWKMYHYGLPDNLEKIMEMDRIPIDFQNMHRYNKFDHKLCYAIPLYYFEKIGWTLFKIYVYNSKQKALVKANNLSSLIWKKGKYTKEIYACIFDNTIDVYFTMVVQKWNNYITNGKIVEVLCEVINIKNKKIFDKIEYETMNYHIYDMRLLSKLIRDIENDNNQLTFYYEGNSDGFKILFDE